MNKKKHRKATEADLINELIRIVDRDGVEVGVIVEHEETKRQYKIKVEEYTPSTREAETTKN